MIRPVLSGKVGGGAGWFIQSYFAQPKKKRERKRELGERERVRLSLMYIILAFGCRRFEDAFHFGCDLGTLLVAVHTEGASEFVGDVESFDAGGFIEFPGRCGGAEFVEEIETLANGGKVFLPELSEYVVDLCVDGGVGSCVSSIRIGFFRRQWRHYSFQPRASEICSARVRGSKGLKRIPARPSPAKRRWSTP